MMGIEFELCAMTWAKDVTFCFENRASASILVLDELLETIDVDKAISFRVRRVASTRLGGFAEGLRFDRRGVRTCAECRGAMNDGPPDMFT